MASSSRYRRALLERLQLPFEIDSPDIDETARHGETPPETATRLAREKAQTVAARRPGAIVIGSDQVASCDSAAIGKPGTHAAARAQLQAMRGKSVYFYTGLCVLDTASDRTLEAQIPTVVQFRPAADLSDALIEAYLLAEQPYDVAGSAKSEGLGVILLESIRSDDPTALVGLPLIALVRMLGQLGYCLPNPHGAAR